MKNKILLLIFIAASVSGFAQVKPAFGVRAGFSSAGISGDANNSLTSLLDYTNGMVTTANRTGYFGGVYADIPFSKGFSLEPGLFYSQKGYQLQGDFNIKGVEFLNANAKATLQSDYLDIPVLLKGNFGGFNVFAGPEVSYLLKSNLQSKAGVLGINLLNNNLDATSQFNRWDVGITGGIGYQFTNGLNITAAYDQGLQPIDANKSLKAYNHALRIGIGVSF